MTNQHQPSDEIVRAVETLVDAVIVQHPNADQEIFLECKVCGEWDGHKPTCFLPVLLAWRNDKPIPTPVRDTVAALVSVARDYLRDTGGCDHSVNICVCGIKQAVDDGQELLASASLQTR